MYGFMTDTLRSMRHDEDFNSFFGVFKKAGNPIKLVGKPTLPRRQKKPNYSILQIVTGYEGPESNAYHPEIAATISNQCGFKLLMQSSVPSMINLNSIKETHER